MRSPNTNVRNDFRDAISSWCGGMDWTYFATMTTPYEMTLKSARRLAENTHRSWSRMTGRQCRLLWVAERNELRDGHHIHGLVWVPDNFRDPHLHYALCEAYQVCTGAKAQTIDKRTGKVKYDKWSRIDLQAYDKKRNAGGYLTKYMTKASSLLDWDILIP